MSIFMQEVQPIFLCPSIHFLVLHFSHWKDTQEETTLHFYLPEMHQRVHFYSRVIPIVMCNSTAAFSFNYEPQKKHISLF